MTVTYTAYPPAVRPLERLGHTVISLRNPNWQKKRASAGVPAASAAVSRPPDEAGVILQAEAWRTHCELVRRHAAEYDPNVLAKLESASAVSRSDYLADRDAVDAWRHTVAADQCFDDQLTGRTGTTARPLAGMPMDAYRVGDNFVAHFDLPGVDPGSIDVSVEGNQLTVTAERSVPQLENAEWAIAERPYGSYSRQLVLGKSLDADRLEASYRDGVLTVSIPVAEKARARKITVTRADAPTKMEHRTIEGESADSANKPVEA